MRRMEADANKGGSDARSLVNLVVSPAGSMGGGGILYQMGGGPLRGYLLEYIILYSFLIPGFYCSIRLSVASSWEVKNQKFINGMTFDL